MRLRRLFTALAVLLSVCGCDTQQEQSNPVQNDVSQTDNSDLSSQDILEETETFSNECFIELGNTVSINGTGAWLDGDCITISEKGVYTVTGEMSDGMIYVDTTDTVKIILNDADITNKSGAVILSGDGKLLIEAAEGTENNLKDGKEYDFAHSFENEELHRSAIHTDGELFISGTGKISINARYKDAVYGGDGLYLNGCILDIEADKAGIGSEKLIEAVNCTMNVLSEGDCIKTESDSEGGITLDNCNLTLSTEKDGIQSGNKLQVNGGSINVNTSGDILADTELSSKGIKAAQMNISGSAVTVNSTDHSIKCDGEAVIDGGNLTLSSLSGKGITSEGVLTINADITIGGSTEGIESKTTLNINGGNINVISSDDGLNTGGDDILTDHSLNISGGQIVINAGGDGIDANGDINVTGGTVVVFGPDNNANSSLDSGDFGYKTNVSGGYILAMGSMGMMSTPSGECVSSQTFSAAEGAEIIVQDESGNAIVSVAAPKAVNGLIFCGANAKSCKILLNGSQVATEEGFNGGFGGMGGFGGGDRGGRGGRGEKPGNMPQLPDGTVPEMPEGGFDMLPPGGNFMENQETSSI